MSDISITYDLLFDILRIEKSREDLQKLEEGFYNNVVEYLNGKESIIRNPNTPAGERELTRIQLGNVKKLLVELYDRRERKIISLAIYKIKTESSMINIEALLTEEKIMFDNLYARLSKYRTGILHNVLGGRHPDIEEKTIAIAQHSSIQDKEDDVEMDSDGTIKSVRFIKPVPRFLGPELETYGPYEENDIASLPSKIANILIKKDRAEEMHLN